MSRLYSTSFGIWKNQAGGINVVNETTNLWVIRYVSVYSGNVGPDVTFLFGDYKTSAIFFGFLNENPGLPWSDHWEGRIVIPPGPGEGFGWETNGFGVDVSVSGYSLTTP